VTQNKDTTDILLWLGGAVFAGVALTWLVVSRPWSATQDLPALAIPDPTPLVAESVGTDSAAARALELPGELDADTVAGGTKEAAVAEPLPGTLSSPLRTAELALKAGMLLEPEGDSAWSLYQEALAVDPSNGAARSGLQEVADILLNRASVAVEQARTADATRLIETVLDVLPDHEQANRLASELSLGSTSSGPPAAPATLAEAVPNTPARPEAAPAAPKPQLEQPKIAAAPQLAKPQAQPKPVAKAPARPRDRFGDAAKAFDTALSDGQLLAPEDASARHYLLRMAELKPDDERTVAARQTLNEILLARADEAIAVLDTLAADVWLTHAEDLGADPQLTDSARLALRQKLINREAARPISVTQLNVLNYVPPRYPTRAVDRDLEGWVDVEFTVGTNGQPEDITIVDASHTRFFRKAAVNAVSQWKFEPHMIRGETVAQRTFARISFKLQ
jgi:TonB family protein